MPARELADSKGEVLTSVSVLEERGLSQLSLMGSGAEQPDLYCSFQLLQAASLGACLGARQGRIEKQALP